jgi:hypothetical protein
VYPRGDGEKDYGTLEVVPDLALGIGDIPVEPGQTLQQLLTEELNGVFALRLLSGQTTVRAFTPEQYGAVGDGVADDTTAVTSALAAAVAVKGQVAFGAATYKITGNLTINDDYVTLAGAGKGTTLAFVNGGLVVDGTSEWRFGTTVKDVRINRTGTSGPAISLLGAGSGTGATDFHFSNVDVYGSTGDCLLIKGAYIGSFHGCSFRAGTTGIRVENDSGAGPNYTSGNLISFHGGEIQGNQVAGILENALGVSFHGVGIEGNTVSGIETESGCYGLGFYGCYWESNGYEGTNSWDLRLGTVGLPDPKAVEVRGCFFTNALAIGHKTSSIQILRGRSVVIDANVWYGFESTTPVVVNEAVAGTVTGEARNNTNARAGGFGPITTLNGATQFVPDFVTGPLRRHFTGTAAPDLASIPANSTTTFTVTATGAATGDDATAHPNSTPEAGLMWAATVTGANTVTVTVANVTTAPIDPVVRTWRVNVWGH